MFLLLKINLSIHFVPSFLRIIISLLSTLQKNLFVINKIEKYPSPQLRWIGFPLLIKNYYH